MRREMSTRCGAEFLFYVVGPSRRRRGHTQQQSLATKPPPPLVAPLSAHLHHTNARTSSPPAESTTTTTLCSSQSPKPTNQNSSCTWRMLHSPAAAAGAVARGGEEVGAATQLATTQRDSTRLNRGVAVAVIVVTTCTQLFTLPTHSHEIHHLPSPPFHLAHAWAQSSQCQANEGGNNCACGTSNAQHAATQMQSVYCEHISSSLQSEREKGGRGPRRQVGKGGRLTRGQESHVRS